MPKPETVTLKQLRAFAAVCETGSITHAAAQLSLTAPAVHTQLKQLETNMNSTLLDRSTDSGMVPTEAGRVLLSAQEKIAAAMGNAAAEIDAMNRGLRGFVRLGVVSTGKYFAPFIVAHLNKALPEIEIELMIGNRNQTIDSLNSGSLDFAIMGRPPRIPDLDAIHLGPHPHVLIASPDNPLARKDRITAEDILNSKILLREPGSGTRILAMRFLDRIGEGQVYSSIVMQSNETIKQAVLAGLGLAIISAHTVLDELKEKKLAALEFPMLPITRSWFLVGPDHENPGGASGMVLNEITANADKLLRTADLHSLNLT